MAYNGFVLRQNFLRDLSEKAPLSNILRTPGCIEFLNFMTYFSAHRF